MRSALQVGADFRADVAATRRAITRNTIGIVASAPNFPPGMIDPIAELGRLALERGIPLVSTGRQGEEWAAHRLCELAVLRVA